MSCLGVKRLSFRSIPIILLSFLLSYSNLTYSAESIESCYNKILSFVMTLGHIPSDSEIQTAFQQCDGTFSEVDAVVQQCHEDKVNEFVALGRPPTTVEMDQAIQECSSLAQQTVEESLPDPCADGPEGFENFIPEEYASLYASGDPQFIETFNAICQEQAEQVKSSVISNIAADYEQAAKLQYQDAVNAANANNWIVSTEGQEIKYLSDSGVPFYNITTESKFVRNYQEATMVGTDSLWGSFTGEDLTIGLWDAGSVNDTHKEYQNRIQWSDTESAIIDSHPTHVAGTLVASGTENIQAKGMAPDAKVSAYNWNYNISELFSSAAQSAHGSGLLISNHSYGILSGWTYYPSGVPDFPEINWIWGGLDCDGFAYCDAQEDYKHGLYNQDAFELDYISYLLPYHLIVKAAGNNSSEGPEDGTKHLAWNWNGSWAQIESTKTRAKDCGHDNGYDCLMPDSTAKNILTVGAVDSNKTIAFYSSRGPTDDWRIKPDIVAKGDQVNSTWTDGDYRELSGTSMATPVVSGSLLLLQQKYKSLNQNEAMRAATLKALAIHSADDIAPVGPDFIYGWGLLNTQRAASLLDSLVTKQQVMELRLNDGGTYSYEFKATTSEPIVATIVWNDYPENSHNDSVDPSDIILSNDLDLRIINNGITSYPWKMSLSSPSAAAETGDNIRDNVEQVVIYNPIIGEKYQIVVSHKNTLKTDSILFRESCGDNDSDESSQKNFHQCFSLVVSQGELGIIDMEQVSAQAEVASNGIVNLYLPAVNYLEQTYSANLQMLPNSNPIQFVLKNFSQRKLSTADNVTLLDPASLDLNIQELSYANNSWKAYLSKDESSSELRWILKEINLLQVE